MACRVRAGDVIPQVRGCWFEGAVYITLDVMDTGGKRRLKIAMVLGTIGVAAAWVFFLLSPQHRLASEFIQGPAVLGRAGTVRFSIPSSFRLIGHGSSMTYYVVGSDHKGFLRLVLEKSDSGLRVKSAAFDGLPLAIASADARSAGQ
jgi:hypothetical protein